MNLQDIRHIDAGEKVTITDRVQAPDGAIGTVAEFGRADNGESLAKIYVPTIFGGEVAAWYKTNLLKKI